MHYLSSGFVPKASSHDLHNPFVATTMAPTECNYEIHDKEMLAIIHSLSQCKLTLRDLTQGSKYTQTIKP